MTSESLEALFSKTKPGDLGIIGDPVEHSLSPAMQNAAFRMWGKTFSDRKLALPTYHKFRVRPAELAEAVRLTKKHRLLGLNVTVPHKLSIVPMLDILDASAQRFGAVNTVSLVDTGLKGSNTDGDGFKLAIAHDLMFDPAGRSALVLGAGGTGQVIVKQLLALGIDKIFWWNRTPEKMDEMNGHKHIEKRSSAAEAVKAGEAVDLVVNATSIGLNDSDGLPVPGLKFHKDQFVFDVIYHRETALMKTARTQGAHVSGGLPMLLYQGAEAFKIWTGCPPPIDIMRASLTDALAK